ncbi:MAG: hypothetical protein V4682_03335 [Patescibacteria group bacterium]
MLAITTTAGPQDSVEAFKARLFEGIDLLCRVFWQCASPGIRRKYPRFQMTEPEFRKHCRAYHVRKDTYSVEEMIDILDRVVPLRAQYSGSLDTASGGTMLRHVSFAGCMLGFDASPGDLEIAVRRLQSIPVLDDTIDPRAMYALYLEGDPALFAHFWNAMLTESSKRLTCLFEERGQGSQRCDVFWLDSERHCFAIDREIVGTYYHLHMSLLGVVEPIAGHA